MTSRHSSAPSRAAGGVTHIRARQTSHFTVLANRLAQRAGSAVTVGVAAYILSLPDGSPVTIQALCAHFAEGKVVISAALRELEDGGWLERRVERGPGGRIVTRTFAYDLPGAVPEKTEETEETAGVQEAAYVQEAAGSRETETATEAEPAGAPAPPAADLLVRLRHRDRRLLLSEREIAALAPAVAEWLDRGIAPQAITAALTDGLPPRINRRPARLLAHRLAVLRPPAPMGPPPGTGRSPVVPLQNCDGCDRAFRADRPGCCLSCRAPERGHHAA
ncbi:hypothetical protein [Streptomyces natalensis]|uniref:DNA-binding protein n=1 Tax=Streptomyces natalensis ATCC 27448 TaxID=1240678 RepID=A0A0D7CD74_9ACTN|nr:hypothetical protein [Streptomyces natalensis]KIZ13996.1 hypothetical protein SNA_33240 [Streptomyces natalensis ATCC 27448]